VLETTRQQLRNALKAQVSDKEVEVKEKQRLLHEVVQQLIARELQSLGSKQQLLDALSPHTAMRRGYALVTAGGKVVRSVRDLTLEQTVNIDLIDGKARAQIKEVL
jgi:exodeoxyribonuclease VII large subunit